MTAVGLHGESLYHPMAAATDHCPTVEPAHGATEHGLAELLPPMPPGASQADIEARPSRPGHGGKWACAKQRELRACCLQQRPVVYDVDLTDNWPWQDLLKSMFGSMVSTLFEGHRATGFSFRLLKHQMDCNYMKIDSGERHVFEPTRSDGAAIQMHFHKKGNMYPPRLIQQAPRQVLQSTGAAAQNETFLMTEADLRDDIAATPVPMSKNEVHIALQNILARGAAEHTGPRAVEITDSSSLEWRRWLVNCPMNREFLGVGITRVFAVPARNKPELCFVRSDGPCVQVAPATPFSIVTVDALPSSSACSSSTPWMQLRL